MLTPQQITQIKAVSIIDYLQSIGHNPVKESSGQLVYFSPKNTEASPSFFVEPTKNVFADYSGPGERGDVIRLVQYLTGCSFTEAVKTLQNFDPSQIDRAPVAFSFSGQQQPKDPNYQVGKFGIIDVRPLQHGALLQYVAGRGISKDIAQTYLKEVHYMNNGKSGLYAVGFGNDKGGYSLRSKSFKCATAPNWITTIEAANSDVVSVFEGFFDFLSACVFFGYSKPHNTTIVLNSTSNLNKALERLKVAKRVNVFLDNDKAGKETLQRIETANPNTGDRSHIYKGYKDFNDYIARISRGH
ncbi:MAG: hypothetical protein EAZ14_01880 [Runella slithyformis]|jgi:DNA primase|nr:MAG: hypothetical protein EAZ14_01880 [Runella slithyformis]